MDYFILAVFDFGKGIATTKLYRADETYMLWRETCRCLGDPQVEVCNQYQPPHLTFFCPTFLEDFALRLKTRVLRLHSSNLKTATIRRLDT
jgi:hypothetical protein